MDQINKNDLEDLKNEIVDQLKEQEGTILVEKVTPVGDLSWYIKWAATVIGIIGMSFAALNVFPLNIFFTFISTCLWLTVGLLWRDRALVVANGFVATILFFGIMKYILEHFDIVFDFIVF